jgi:hypothetical protein
MMSSTTSFQIKGIQINPAAFSFFEIRPERKPDMAMKKKRARRKPAIKKPASRKPARLTRSQSRTKPPARTKAKAPIRSQTRKKPARSAAATKQAIEAMNERLDIMLPEVMFRIAALEHMLVEKGFCSHDQLNRARQFIQEQEES